MRASRLLFFPAVILLCCLVCRAQDYTAIKGNWHLAGSWDRGPSSSPLLAVSVGVDGNELFAAASIQTTCVGAMHPALKGKIAANGTFLLEDSDLTISGTIPEPGSAQWAGHYSYSVHKPRECSAVGDFVATKLPLLKGVYSGSVQAGDHSGTVIAVTIDVNQGELIRAANSDWIPLQATMTLSGSSAEFPSEKLTTVKFPPEVPTAGEADSGGWMAGNGFNMLFIADNGERMLVGGNFFDDDALTLHVRLHNLSPTKRAFEHAFGTLTRASDPPRK